MQSRPRQTYPFGLFSLRVDQKLPFDRDWLFARSRIRMLVVVLRREHGALVQGVFISTPSTSVDT